MNRAHTTVFRLLVGSLLLWSCFAGKMQAQTPPSQESTKPANAKPDQKKAEDDPFAPEQAPPLPAGMTGSNVNDPRAKLTPGMYDAGEASMGMKHILLLKKPGAFQIDASDPSKPEVQKTLGQLGIPDTSKMPKPIQSVIAQLA